MRFYLLILSVLSARIAIAERILPADVQFELIFPRNETYAPTQLFPIVIGVSNLDAVWPLNIRFNIVVKSLGFGEGAKDTISSNFSSYRIEDYSIGYSSLTALVGRTPGKHFFYFPILDMTNGTEGNFALGWKVNLARRCYANDTSPSNPDPREYAWSNSPSESGFGMRGLYFRTEFGAQLPNIEALVDSCPATDTETAAAIRVTDVKKHPINGEDCPVFEEYVETDDCVFKSAAKDLARNVSVAMLDRLKCEEGDWQTMTAPCEEKKSMGALRSGRMEWMLLVPMVAVSCVGLDLFSSI